MSLMDSQFMKNLENGQLPPFEITMSTETMVELAFWVIVTAVLIMVLHRAFFK